MKRPEIQQTRMMSAWVESHRSTCDRLHVGCVIADHRGVILSSGYNGAPAGLPHCIHDNSDLPCTVSLHAETNAILWAARRGIRVEDAYLYTTHEPCYECSKLIIQAGIAVVYFGSPYSRNSGRDLLSKANVQIYQVACGPYEPNLD